MSYSSAIGGFVIGYSPIGVGAIIPPAQVTPSSGFAPLPIEQIVPAYPYEQYQDDPNIQAFFSSYNTVAQGYLSWFNQNPLAVYTDLSGALLDWCATGIYGLARPTISSFTTSRQAGYNTSPFATTAYNAQKVITSGSAQLVSDDIYQRFLTWWLYRGDGQVMTLDWLKRRVSRFLYGAGGTDISYPVSSPPSIQITQPSSLRSYRAAFNTQPYNTNSYGGFTKNPSATILITVPPGQISNILANLIENGLLAVPFEYTVRVVS